MNQSEKFKDLETKIMETNNLHKSLLLILILLVKNIEAIHLTKIKAIHPMKKLNSTLFVILMNLKALMEFGELLLIVMMLKLQKKQILF